MEPRFVQLQLLHVLCKQVPVADDHRGKVNIILHWQLHLLWRSGLTVGAEENAQLPARFQHGVFYLGRGEDALQPQFLQQLINGEAIFCQFPLLNDPLTDDDGGRTADQVTEANMVIAQGADKCAEG